LIIYKCNKDTEIYLTNKETKHWSGKPSDPEFQNYTKNAFAEVFKQTAYKVTYPDGEVEYWFNESDADDNRRDVQTTEDTRQQGIQ
jgi:hypothetical protein